MLTAELEEQAAANREYASWIRELLVQREARCPDGLLHAYKRVADPDSQYCWHCPRCGHFSDVPF